MAAKTTRKKSATAKKPAAKKAAAKSSPAKGAAAQWLAKFERATRKGDAAAAAALFAEECYWRDLVAFTWNIKTMEGRAQVQSALAATLPKAKPAQWRVDGGETTANGVTEAWFTFETAVARGRGLLRLKGGKCWTLLTTMVELKGHEERDDRHATRPKGVAHGVHPKRLTWKEERARDDAELGVTRQPYCLIVGGGQGGIVLAARLKRLGVPVLVVEKNKRPGDSWRNRYRSLCLHDPVWYDHLPYLPFPDHWPVYSPKDKIGDWLESYTKIMELDYWCESECQSAAYDAKKKAWTVKVKRKGKVHTLHPKQLVLATGMSGVANVPALPGRKDFKGAVAHSSQFRDGRDCKGKRCVILGANNSAHDIAAEMHEQGAKSVTMVQRSSTHVAKSETLMELALGGLYSREAVANGIDVHKADLIFASVPYKIMHAFHIPVYEAIAKRDRRMYDGLRRAGFNLNFGEDGSGLFMLYLRRGSGYYIDVGASQLIIDGKVKVKSGVTIARLKPGGVVLSDGAELPADVLVCATGYASMNGWAAKLISREVADKVGKCWGLGSDTKKDPGPWEGELRNMWKPTQQEALWFHGGNLHQSRHYSQFLSLQIKARMEGISTPVYGMTKPHHLA